jgi:hypothetical protein
LSRTPYEDTSVTVSRSQEMIRGALRKAGAEGVSFSEEWNPPKCIVRFLWRPEDGAQQTVRLEVTPLPAEGRSQAARERAAEQRWRQAWRGIAWYLDSTLKAATFGLVRFEDVFLSFIELPDQRTLGDVVIPQIRSGQLALGAGEE